MQGLTSTSYEYTDNGDLHRKTDGSGKTTYTYDALGNLRRVILPDGTQIDYLIDGRNRRIGKKVNGTLVQQWLYQDQLNPVAELDGQGNLVAEFVYASKLNVPDYMIKGGETYRIISDQLGSVRLVIDVATGAVAERIDYDEFGIVTFEQEYDGNGALMSLDPVTRLQPFGFAGGLRDPQTRIVRFGVRDYDAQTARWTAGDPVGFGGGGDSNLAAYVFEDPVNATDATGLFSDISESTAVIATTGILLGGVVYSLQSRGKGRNGPDPNTEKLLKKIRRNVSELRQVFEPPPNLRPPTYANPFLALAEECLKRFGPNGTDPSPLFLTICLTGVALTGS